jgi:hypothetical protein
MLGIKFLWWVLSVNCGGHLLSLMNSYPSNWSDIRQLQLEHDGHRCRTCGITSSQLKELGWGPLQVHHVNEGPPHYSAAYHREEVGVNLMSLCESCHDGITNSVRRQRYQTDPRFRVEVIESENKAVPLPAPQVRVTVEVVDYEVGRSVTPPASSTRPSIGLVEVTQRKAQRPVHL